MCLVMYGHEHRRYSAYFDQLFRLRYKLFVEERGWSLPSRRGMEIDQYDTDDAVYFVSLTDNGSIEASARMTPTMHSSLLADYFPHLIETGEAPRSPHIYEATRYMVQPARKTRAAIKKAKVKLLVPLLEWCLEQHLTHLQTVIDAGALSSFLKITPQTRALGLSHPFGGGKDAPGGGECLAFRWPITEEVLDDVRAYGDLDDRHRHVPRGLPAVTMH